MVDKSRQSYLIHLAAAAALYNYGDKDNLKVIEIYLDSKIPAASIEAAISAGHLTNGEVIPLLKAKLNTKDQLLRNAVIESLARLGEKIPEFEISKLLEKNDFNSQRTALVIIGIQKDTRFNSQL